MGERTGESTVHTFCRVCEPACGLLAELRDGELVRLRPDDAHPVTRGFACHKGLAGVELHRDPDRLDHPLRRRADGRFERVGWDEAIAEIAARLRAILDAHGPDAVAPYVGNPTAFNTLAGPAIGALFGQLGARRSFSSGTQDCANKFAGSEAVFGSSTMHPIPDLRRTDFFLSLGSNPRVSHASFLSLADPVAVLREIVARGGRVVHVNPRRIEGPRSSAGETLWIRPDTDVYLLAAMIHEIDRTVGFDAAATAAHGAHVDGLRAFVARYPAERVAGVTGIPAETIRALARDFAAARAASVHMSTGVNMGRQGTLAYWLVQMLSFVTGNLDRPGGNVLSVGFYESAKAGRRDFAESFVDTPFGRLRRGSLPGTLLADAIESETSPVRALVVVAGNPLLSIGGEARLRRAFEQLELLVVLDLYRNPTAEYAHYVLPCTDAFERADVNITGLGLQLDPWIQWTDAVVPPRGERREEWWILGRLAQALGLRSPFDRTADGTAPGGDAVPPAALWGRIEHMLRGRRLSLDAVRTAPHGTVAFGALETGRFYRDHLQTPDERVDCCPAGFAEAIERAEEIFRELAAEPRDRLKLISLRDLFMHNSWFANLPRMKRGAHDRNRLHVAPADLEARGLAEGAKVRLASAWGELDVEVTADPELMPGVVALSHGYGHANTPGMRVAERTPGVNPNALLPNGPGSFEPLSSQAFMTGVPVELAAL